MLAKLIDWSGRNRFLVLLATLFVIAAGVIAVLRTPIDALPDLSDVQVIVYTEYPGQAPQVVEDQVTYPLTTAMLSVPKSRVVRGFSFFGASFVYMIFEDGTDIYWARSRVLEYLNFASGRMPKGVTPQIGPDATGVGWVYQYALHRQRQDPRRTAHDPGLVRALPAHQGPRRCRSGLHRRLRADLPGHRRSGEAARLRHSADEGRPGDPRLQPRRGRPRGGNGRDRVHGARQGLPARQGRHRTAGGEGRQAARRC
jgi:hypothetical protein